MRTVTLLSTSLPVVTFYFPANTKTDFYGKLSNGHSFLELNLSRQLTVLHQVLIPAGWRPGTLWVFMGPLSASDCSANANCWIFFELDVRIEGADFTYAENKWLAAA